MPGAPGGPSPHGVAAAADRPTGSAADLRRRQLRVPTGLTRPSPASPPRCAPARTSAARRCAAAPVARRMFGRRETLPGVGLYLDGGFGVGKTHLLASVYRRLPDSRRASQGVRHIRRTHPAGRGFRIRRVHRSAGRVHGGVHRRVRTRRSGQHHSGLPVAVGRWLSTECRLLRHRTPCPSNSVRGGSPPRISSAKSTRWQVFSPPCGSRDRTTAIVGCRRRRRRVSDAEVDRAAARISRRHTGRFDALCAHLATMHPSRYLTLIEGVTAVHMTGVHPLDDQSVALRLVSLTDRLYDAGIPVVASGAKLDTVFSEEMLAGGYRKKYLRATSRLLALSSPRRSAAGAPSRSRSQAVADLKKTAGPGDLESVSAIEPLRPFVGLIYSEPHRGRTACAAQSRPDASIRRPARRGTPAARTSWTAPPGSAPF